MQRILFALLFVLVSMMASAEPPATQTDWNSRHLWANLFMQISVRPEQLPDGWPRTKWQRACVYIPTTRYCRCFFPEVDPKPVWDLLLTEINKDQKHLPLDIARRDREICSIMDERRYPK